MRTDSLKILFLAHDLSDAAVQKKIQIMTKGGASVSVAGFRRSNRATITLSAAKVIDLGRTYDANLTQRIWTVLREIVFLRQYKELFQNNDIIIARNLEMLAIAVRGKNISNSNPIIIYESLDIHRLLLNRGLIGKTLRAIEGYLAKHAAALITSSPAFVSNYFQTISNVRLPIKIIENKVLLTDQPNDAYLVPKSHQPDMPWVIGWFGIIRCRKSLKLLANLAQESQGTIKVIIRGRPALDQFDDFNKTVKETPGLEFLGPYKNPDDLDKIYRDVHFNWTIDMFEEGLNSKWLLPNRLYEGGAFNKIPVAQSAVETGEYIERLGIGVLLEEPLQNSLEHFFKELTQQKFNELQEGVRKVSPKTWAYDKNDCIEFVNYLQSFRKDRSASVKEGNHG